ncbi:MAG: hypothetical protein QG656_2632 [Candidatus Hydrogenedentes bacterium]|nr:hypothetical protein [Candidatus Hydrogenedentota bacterium]
MNRIALLAFVAGLLAVSCAHDLDIQRGVVFAEPGGKRLQMNLYERPDDGQGLRPGMVLIHGGAWLFGPRTQHWWFCHEFARRGYVVMTIDYRMLPMHHFPDCVYDCKAGVRWMRLHAAEYRIDPDRIVTFGASAGGHLAGFLAATDPEDGFEGTENPGPSSEVQAAVCLYGAMDLSKYRDPPHWNLLSPLGKRYIGWLVRDAGAATGQDPFDAGSPITYLKPDTCPVFLAHGTSDWIVHHKQSEAFHERLEALGVPTELHLYSHRNHGFDYIHYKQRRRMFEKMMRFLDQYIGPAEPECAEAPIER